MSSSYYENEILDTSWIDEEDKLLNINEESKKQIVPDVISMYFFYIDDSNDIENIDKLKYNVDINSGLITSEEIVKIIEEKKILFRNNQNINYSLLDILSFQVNLTHDNLQKYIDDFPDFNLDNDDDDDDDDNNDDDNDDDNNSQIKITNKSANITNIQDIENNYDDDDDDDDDNMDDNEDDDDMDDDYDDTDDDSHTNIVNKYRKNMNMNININSNNNGSNNFIYIKEDLTKYTYLFNNFFKKYSYFENIQIQPSIFIFHSLTELFFIFKKRSSYKKPLPPLRSILKKKSVKHRDRNDIGDGSNNKTKKNVSINLPQFNNRIKSKNSTKKVMDNTDNTNGVLDDVADI